MENIRYESPLEVKTEQVIIRLTSDEKAMLFEQARLTGVSMSALIRLMLSQYANKDLTFK